MIKISQTVNDILMSDEIALESLRKGILNLSSYALIIQPEIEKILYKPVRIGSIVTALSRIGQNLDDVPPLRPVVKIENINIKSLLCEITFDKNAQNLLYSKQLIGEDFIFSITQGVNEISIIFNQTSKNKILNNFKILPKGVYENLVALTISFNEKEYIEIPNTIYSLVSLLASKRINLIEIVSTFTEISFIVRQKDMKETLDVLKNNFNT